MGKKKTWRAASSPYADQNAEAKSIRLELGIDINTRLPGQKSRGIVVVPQVPKLVLKVHHTKIQRSVLVIIDPAAKLVNNAVVGLTRSISNVSRADQEVPIGTEPAVNVVQFGPNKNVRCLPKSPVL